MNKPTLPFKLKNCRLIFENGRTFSLGSGFVFYKRAQLKLHEFGSRYLKKLIPGKNSISAYFVTAENSQDFMDNNNKYTIEGDDNFGNLVKLEQVSCTPTTEKFPW